LTLLLFDFRERAALFVFNVFLTVRFVFAILSLLSVCGFVFKKSVLSLQFSVLSFATALCTGRRLPE
jgi:hypothetical protein